MLCKRLAYAAEFAQLCSKHDYGTAEQTVLSAEKSLTDDMHS